MTISLNQQIEEIQAIIDSHASYARHAKMRESLARHRLSRLEAARATIAFIAKHRDAFVAFAKLYEVEVR